MKPAHKNMAFDPVREFHGSKRGIVDSLIKIITPEGNDTDGLLIEKRENDRNIVRSETPEDILFGAEFADVETVGINILDFAECT